MGHSGRAGGQDCGGEAEFKDRYHDGHAAAYNQRLKRLRFHDSAEQSPDALSRDGFRIHAERAGEQAGLQDTAGVQ